ncbi:hypothetical protein BDV93DRAFT_526295 [Ceratobasidium sp. AG-I]|nr:hypothetical protein BDV93DRAFT_526295 [Ceratobasidium sp. AG-I]
MDRVMYPDVSDKRMEQIYEESESQLIWGYGYFVDFFGEFKRVYSVPLNNGLPHNPEDKRSFIPRFKAEIVATGAQVLWCPTPPKELERGASLEEGWLVIVTTGFNKTAHVAADEEMIDRVKLVLKREDNPGWWLMREFSYPPPPKASVLSVRCCCFS